MSAPVFSLELVNKTDAAGHSVGAFLESVTDVVIFSIVTSNSFVDEFKGKIVL